MFGVGSDHGKVSLRMKVKPPACVMLDAVGTLFEASPAVEDVYQHMGARYGQALSREEILTRFRIAMKKFWMNRPSYFPSIEEAEQSERRLWEQIVHEILPDITSFDECFQELFVHFSRGEAWKVYPDVPPFLDYLSQTGIPAWVGSNFDQRLIQVVREKSELTSITRVVPSTITGSRKPDRRFFLGIIEELNVAPDEIMMIGDSWDEDVMGALNAGLTAVWLARSRAPVLTEEMSLQVAPYPSQFFVITSLTELLDLFQVR
jgi:putative hydrolase of the HAD superfamily